MTELDPVDALKQKSGDFARWYAGGREASLGIIHAACPKCGGRVVCAYAEMGVVDYYDTYAHVCLSPQCDFGETRDIFFHSNWGPDGPKPPCPFCEALGAN